IHEDFGDMLEGDPAPFLAGSVEKIGQKFRLDFRALHDVPVIEQCDAADTATGEIDVQGIFAFEVRIAQRVNLDDIAGDGVPTGGAIHLSLVVAIVLQLADESRRSEHFAVEDPIGRAINASAGLVHVAREALIDHASVSEPVISEDSTEDQHNADGGRYQRQAEAGNQKITMNSQAHARLPHSLQPIAFFKYFEDANTF